MDKYESAEQSKRRIGGDEWMDGWRITFWIHAIIKIPADNEMSTNERRLSEVNVSAAPEDLLSLWIFCLQAEWVHFWKCHRLFDSTSSPVVFFFLFAQLCLFLFYTFLRWCEDAHSSVPENTPLVILQRRLGVSFTLSECALSASLQSAAFYIFAEGMLPDVSLICCLNADVGWLCIIVWLRKKKKLLAETKVLCFIRYGWCFISKTMFE